MSLLGNIIWIVFGGLLASIGWLLSGLLLCATVVGIPFGIQCFKIASLTLAPFGKKVDIGNFGGVGLLANVLWIVIFGWELFLGHIALACIFAISIIGLPFAKQHVKLAKLALVPFGADIQ